MSDWLELQQGSDLLSLPLAEITISGDGADLGDIGTLLSVINFKSRDIGLDPFLSEFRTVLVLRVSPTFYVAFDGH